MSTEFAGASPAHAHPRLVPHFEDLPRQIHAARFGMWIFLATEILLFAGLFVAFAEYRTVYPGTFERASRTLDLPLGTLNTVLLLTSSFSVAASIHLARHGRRRAATVALLATLACALAFLVIKAFEYQHKLHEGALPGPWYRFEAVRGPGASLFFTLYFLMTGLHAIHVTIGMGVLGWLAWRTRRGDFDEAYHLPLELGGLYWHLVDIVWIFLYPLLYLV